VGVIGSSEASPNHDLNLRGGGIGATPVLYGGGLLLVVVADRVRAAGRFGGSCRVSTCVRGPGLRFEGLEFRALSGSHRTRWSASPIFAGRSRLGRGGRVVGMVVAGDIYPWAGL